MLDSQEYATIFLSASVLDHVMSSPFYVAITLFGFMNWGKQLTTLIYGS